MSHMRRKLMKVQSKILKHIFVILPKSAQYKKLVLWDFQKIQKCFTKLELFLISGSDRLAPTLTLKNVFRTNFKFCPK